MRGSARGFPVGVRYGRARGLSDPQGPPANRPPNDEVTTVTVPIVPAAPVDIPHTAMIGSPTKRRT
jgi:hypothetical protein